jgi:hypothetical protein
MPLHQGDKMDENKPFRVEITWNGAMVMFAIGILLLTVAYAMNKYNTIQCNNFYIKQFNEKCMMTPTELSIYHAQNLNLSGNLTIWSNWSKTNNLTIK